VQPLPTPFLDAQTDMSRRDTLNFLAGVVAIHPRAEWYLEDSAGAMKAEKINFRIDGETVIALWISKKRLRLEVRDKQRLIDGLEERGRQFEVKGWRNAVFRPDTVDGPERAASVLRLYLSHYHGLRTS